MSAALEEVPITVDNLLIQITVSIGASFYAEGMDLSSLLILADHALYRVKENGNANFYIIPENMK